MKLIDVTNGIPCQKAKLLQLQKDSLSINFREHYIDFSWTRIAKFPAMMMLL